MNEEIKPDRISFKQVFPSGMQYLPLHIGIEYPVLPGQDPNEIFKTAVEQVRKWNLEYNPGMAAALEYAGEPKEEVKLSNEDKKQQAIGSQIEAINGCTSLKSVEIFKKLVGRENIPSLTEAFNNKLKELQ